MSGYVSAEHHHHLEVEFGPPITRERIPCKMGYSDTPAEPYVDDEGRCITCGEEVDWVQFDEPRPHCYYRRATPHDRWACWYSVSDDRLLDLLESISAERGGGDWLWDVRHNRWA